MATMFDDWREQAGVGSEWTDEDIIYYNAQQSGGSLEEWAQHFGYDQDFANEGNFGKTWESAKSGYMESWNHFGNALGLDRNDAIRDRKAEQQLLDAANTGIRSYQDVEGAGDALEYVANTAIGSAPYFAEFAASSVFPPLAYGKAVKGLSDGARVLSRAEKARIGMGSAFTGALPSSTGEILKNQYDQSGEYDLGYAIPAGAAYSAVNLLAGPERIFNRLQAGGGLGRGLTNSRAANAAIMGGGQGIGEAFEEVIQEGLSQYGRQSVDPSYDPYSPEAMDAYAESAVGGFTLGLIPGAAQGGFQNRPVDILRKEQAAKEIERRMAVQDEIDRIRGIGQNQQDRREATVGDPATQQWLAAERERQLAQQESDAALAGEVDALRNMGLRAEQRAIEAEAARLDVLEAQREERAQQLANQNSAINNIIPPDPMETATVEPNQQNYQPVSYIDQIRKQQEMEANVAAAEARNKKEQDDRIEKSFPGSLTAGLANNEKITSANINAAVVRAEAKLGKEIDFERSLKDGTITDWLKEFIVGKTGEQLNDVKRAAAKERKAILNELMDMYEQAKPPVDENPNAAPEATSEFKFTPAQQGIYEILANNPELTDAQIAEQTGSTQQNISKLIKQMRARAEKYAADNNVPMSEVAPAFVEVAPDEQTIGINDYVDQQQDEEVDSTDETNLTATDLNTGGMTVRKSANDSRTVESSKDTQAASESQAFIDANDPTSAPAQKAAEKVWKKASKVLKSVVPYSSLPPEAKADFAKRVQAAGKDAESSKWAQDNAADVVRLNKKRLNQMDEAKKKARKENKAAPTWDTLDGNQEEAVVDTTKRDANMSKAKRIWDATRQKNQRLPAWEELDDAQQDRFVRAFVDNNGQRPNAVRAAEAINSKDAAKVAELIAGFVSGRRESPYFSKRKGRQETGSTVGEVEAILRNWFGESANGLYDLVQVHQTAKEAFKAVGKKVPMVDLKDAQGFIDPRDGRTVHIIADNVSIENVAGVIVHEVGVHIGLADTFKSEFQALTAQVKKWQNAPLDSIEHDIFHRATARVVTGRLDGSIDENQSAEELVAYAVEEAINMGVRPDPNSTNALEKWLGEIREFFAKMFQKFLGADKVPDLSAQELVDISYAAAQGAMADLNTEPGADLDATEEQVAAYLGGFLVTTGEFGSITTDMPDSFGFKTSDKVLIDDNIPGLEAVRWEKDATFGGHNEIITFAEQHLDEDGNLEAIRILVTSKESRDYAEANATADGITNYDMALAYVTLNPDSKYDNHWHLSLEGPSGVIGYDGLYKLLKAKGQATDVDVSYGTFKVTKFTGVDGKGIKGTELDRLFTQVRRQITRYRNGGIPSIEYLRITGSAASASKKDSDGREGRYEPAALRARFSKRKTSNYTHPSGGAIEYAETFWEKAKDAFEKIGPAVMSLHALVKAYSEKLPTLREYYNNVSEMENMQVQLQIAGHKVAAKWRALDENVRKSLASVMMKATSIRGENGTMGFHVDKPFNHPANSHIKKFTPEMRKAQEEFNNLPAEAKEVYIEARDKLMKDWKLRGELYKNIIAQTYDDLISKADSAEEKARLEKERDAYIKEHSKQLSQIKVYFPLRRFGAYIVQAKSAKMQEIERKLESEELPEAQRKILKRKLDVLRRSPEHYAVAAREKESDAKRLAQAMEADGFEGVTVVLADQADPAQKDITKKGVEKIKDYMTANVSPSERLKIEQMLAEMYVAQMPENNALATELQRQGIAGADEDMLRAFATTIEKNAFYMSRFKYRDLLTENLIAMKKDARQHDSALSTKLEKVYQEVKKRQALDLEYHDTPILNGIAQASGMYHLVSPSYWMVNATQPWFIGAPVMAARFGMGKTLSEMRTSFVDAGRLVKGTIKPVDLSGASKSGWKPFNDLDTSLIEDANERAMVNQLINRGRIDINVTHDLGVMARGGSDTLSRLSTLSMWPAHQTEVINRLTVAMATYRLARKKGMSHEKAVELTDEMVIDTQIDYSNVNAPRLMKHGTFGGLGKLVFQFRKYQHAMIQLLVQNAVEAFKGDKQARRTLAYMFGTQFLTAGAVGLPMANVAGMAFNALLDDDDEEGDARTQMYNALVNNVGKELADVIVKGVPAAIGMDLTKRTGMGDLFSPLPFLRTNADTGKDLLANVLFASAGAWTSIPVGVADSIMFASDGQWARAMEAPMPKAVKDVFKAYRYGTEGVRGRNKQEGVDAADMNAWDITQRALGLTPFKEAEYYEAKTALYNTHNAIEDRRSRILRDIAVARMDKDFSTEQQLRSEVKEFNKKHPKYRIKGSTISKSIKNRRNARRERVNEYNLGNPSEKLPQLLRYLD